MSVYKLERTQELSISQEEAWSFFSDPGNLVKITPEYMDFKIIHGADSEIYAGQIIEYRVKPVLRIPITWVTEIKHIVYQKQFVDEQRFGPYSLWHHKHFFVATPTGIKMTDIVHYKLPLGFLGRIAHWLFVKRQLHGIFDFRYKVLESHFGKTSVKSGSDVPNLRA